VLYTINAQPVLHKALENPCLNPTQVRELCLWCLWP
jgi:hypothetical protein